MSAIIAIIIQFLPLILRLFGLAAAGAAGVSYQRLTAADPSLAMTSAPVLTYVGGWGVAGAGLFGFAEVIRNYIRGRVESTSSLIEFITRIITYLQENPDAWRLIVELIGLLKLQGVDTSELEKAVKAARGRK